MPYLGMANHMKMNKSAFARVRNTLLLNHHRSAAYKIIHAKIRAGLYPEICKKWIHELEYKERPRKPRANADMPRFIKDRTPEQHRIAALRSYYAKQRAARRYYVKKTYDLSK